METLKFRPDLIEPIISGKKWCTWRLFYEDKKNLKEGELIYLACRISPTEVQPPFAIAKISKIHQTTLGQLTAEDKEGHELFASETNNQAMYQQYTKDYGKVVNENTEVMVIKFKLIELL